VRKQVDYPAIYINPTTREMFVAQYKGTSSNLVFYIEDVTIMCSEGFEKLCNIKGQAYVENTSYKRVNIHTYTKSLQTQLNELKAKYGGEK